MSKSDRGAKKGKPTISPSKLAKTNIKGKAELSEEDLKRVSGGGNAKVAGWIEG